jgi:hypothetical protein
MIIRFARTVTLPSGNLARNFRFNDRGYGRVQVTYEYTDRRRNHQTARRFTVELLNGKVETIQARSANGGRVEFFKTSTIINELLEMLAEFNEVVKGVAQHRYSPAKVETPVEQGIVSEDDTGLLDTLKTVGGMVMVNILITLATLGVVWYNL